MESLNKSRVVVILLFSVFVAMLLASVPAFSKPGQTRPCTDCHAYPPTLIDVTVDKTSAAVYSDGNFTVAASYTGGANDGKTTSQIAWPEDAANNTLFVFDPPYSVSTTSPTDSLTSTITVPTTLGNYTIRVYAASGSWVQASKETDYENVTVTVKLFGDVNGDRIIDIFDVGSISAHWTGSPPGPLGYDANADINSDGNVDILDIDITSAYWGQTW